MVKPPTRAAEIEIPPYARMPAPEAANFFNITVSGPEVEMLIGYIDLRKLLPNPGKKVEAEITSRIFMSVRGFLLLRAQVEELYGKLTEEIDTQQGDDTL